MDFKYFAKPDLFTELQEKETKCNCCGKTKFCFDATVFYGADEIESICPECLESGQLYKLDISTCSGDIAELERQLKTLNPSLSENEIKDLADKKTTELEKTTPHLVTWQDWAWPCADGDYCKFIGYGSKTLYGKFSGNTDNKIFFTKSLYIGY